MGEAERHDETQSENGGDEFAHFNPPSKVWPIVGLADRPVKKARVDQSERKVSRRVGEGAGEWLAAARPILREWEPCRE